MPCTPRVRGLAGTYFFRRHHHHRRHCQQRRCPHAALLPEGRAQKCPQAARGTDLAATSPPGADGSCPARQQARLPPPPPPPPPPSLLPPSQRGAHEGSGSAVVPLLLLAPALHRRATHGATGLQRPSLAVTHHPLSIHSPGAHAGRHQWCCQARPPGRLCPANALANACCVGACALHRCERTCHPPPSHTNTYALAHRLHPSRETTHTTPPPPPSRERGQKRRPGTPTTQRWRRRRVSVSRVLAHRRPRAVASRCAFRPGKTHTPVGAVAGASKLSAHTSPHLPTPVRSRDTHTHQWRRRWVPAAQTWAPAGTTMTTPPRRHPGGSTTATAPAPPETHANRHRGATSPQQDTHVAFATAPAICDVAQDRALDASGV